MFYIIRYRTEKAMAPHSSTLAWKIPWTEEPGRLQSMRSLTVTKTKIKHNYTLTRRAIIKKKDNIKFGKDVERLESSYIACGNIKRQSQFGKQFGTCSKN